MNFPTFHFLETSIFWIYGKIDVKSSPEVETNRAKMINSRLLFTTPPSQNTIYFSFLDT
jgi:hypothetical protein